MEHNQPAQDIRSFVRGQRAFTMIEMLAVIFIMGILTLITISIISALFNSNIAAASQANQRDRITFVKDYLSSKTDSTQVGEVGLLTEDGTKVNPVSLAGDQIAWCHQLQCFRVFYIARARELRVAYSSNGPASIRPVRGPNESVPGGGYSISDPDHPLYDRVLDSGDSFVLADHFVLNAAGSTDLMQHMLLVPMDGDMTPLYIDLQADSSSTNWIYDDPQTLDQISSFGIYGAMDHAAQAGINLSPRPFEQDFPLDQ